MKCPILSTPPPRTAFTEHFADVDCLGAECGWYDQANGCCSTVALNQNLVAIGNLLGKFYDYYCLGK